MRTDSKNTVRAYWDARPCGSSLATSPSGTAEFFQQVEAARERLEPFIASFAEFEKSRGCRLLEIGVGLGTDFVQFGRAGAVLTGVDLTATAVDLVRRRLELEGLEGDVRVADAEELPFADDSFDLVYSWGVLHHTPDTPRAVSEIRRVLVTGGEARVMLYSRRSWVAFGLWLRYALASGQPWRTISDVIAAHMESDGTKAYTESELRRLFSCFARVETQRFTTPYDRRVAGPLTRLGGGRFGWFVGVRAS
jgi:SAM-dependent methyltransferase